MKFKVVQTSDVGALETWDAGPEIGPVLDAISKGSTEVIGAFTLPKVLVCESGNLIPIGAVRKLVPVIEGSA